MKLLTHDLVDMLAGKPYPKEEFFLDVNMYDITETVVLAVKNLPDKCVGLSIRHHVGHKTRDAVRQIADNTGIFVGFT